MLSSFYLNAANFEECVKFIQEHKNFPRKVWYCTTDETEKFVFERTDISDIRIEDITKVKRIETKSVKFALLD